MLSLHQLTCFLATYEHRSLTRAAEELGYAQPSVSEQVRGLEKSLGVQLFRRVGRGVVPTTAADTFRPHAEKVLAAADEAQRAVASIKSLETGTIRFGMFGRSGSATVVVASGPSSAPATTFHNWQIRSCGVSSKPSAISLT